MVTNGRGFLCGQKVKWIRMKAKRIAALACLGLLSSCAKPRPPRALLPGSLLVTYYGNPLSKKMGILGQLPPTEMMNRLADTARMWQRADPGARIRPGLELIAVVASGKPEGGSYCLRTPRPVIEEVLRWARRRGWLLVLDIQPGHSTVRSQIEYLRPYLERPDVELALDPEFEMSRGGRPGTRIGGSDAEDVNVAIIELSDIVRARHLPPKLLLVHRFTDGMLRRRDRIRLDPRVQVAMVMDGFGTPGLKTAIYRREIADRPVEYAGIKLFYKNDKPMLTPAQVLALKPRPSVIIYQ